MYFVYVLKSQRDQKVYVGSTALDPEARLAEHNLGKVRWSRGHRPFSLIFSETFSTRDMAARREKFFKTGKGRLVLKSKINDF